MSLQLVKLINPIQVTIAGTFNPLGAYNAGTDYAPGDMVDYEGSSYIMYSDAAAGTVPTNTTYWGLVARGYAGDLADIDDVTISSIASGEILVWNGSAWVNNTLAEAGIAAASHTHTESEITDLGTYQVQLAEGAFADGDKTKLDGIEAGATADQSAAEIKTAYESNADTNAYTDAEQTKLSGIEALADVTDATNVNAAGAVMNSDVTAKGDMFVATGSGALTNLPVGTNNYVLTADSAQASGVKWAAVSGSGDALTTNPLSQFAATTSAQLAGVISDETGSGALVFGTSPTLTTPNLGTPSTLVATNATGTAASLTAGTATKADGLTSATTTVSVSAATAPSSGQVLTATSSTAATWQTPSSGGGGMIATGSLSNANSAATANVEYGSCLFLSKAVTIDRLCAYVAVTEASQTVQLGLWDSAKSNLVSATGVPSGAGLFTVSISSTSIGPGLVYFGLVNQTGGATMTFAYQTGANDSVRNFIKGGQTTLETTVSGESGTARSYWIGAYKS